jgi:putative endonuclease
MYYVYFLKDPHSNWIYVGYTADLQKRLEQHRAGNTQTTRKFSSQKLIYYEAYLSAADAREREKKLKQYGNSLGILKKRLKNSLLDCSVPKVVMKGESAG